MAVSPVPVFPVGDERFGTDAAILAQPPAPIGGECRRHGKRDGVASATRATGEVLRRALLHQHGIEALFMHLDGGLWVRLSAQVYNELADYTRLGETLPAVLSDQPWLDNA